MTRQQYARLKARTEQSNHLVAGKQGAKLERTVVRKPLDANQDQAGNPARYAVRVTSYRRRLLDEDRISECYHVDSVRYAGLIHSDAPGATSITSKQIKVKRPEDEGTLIEIEYL